MNEYFEDEMEKLEKQQRRERELSQNNLRDRYNQPESQFEIQDFKTIVSSRIEFAPKEGGLWSSYGDEIKIYAKMNAKKNWDTHVDNPYKVWHTHVLPLGCFMCEDTNLISVLVRVIGLMASQYPDNRF